jgi:glucose/arabinose dehydrogenase
MGSVRILAPLVLLLAALACSGDDAEDATPTSAPVNTSAPNASVTAAPGATPEADETPGSTTGPDATAQAAIAGLPGSVSLERVFPNLSFEGLTGLYQLPSGAWLATEQRGRVTVIDRAGTQATVSLDITDRVSDGGFEEGLLGLAIAPDFIDSGAFYVYYSASNPRRSVVSRFASSNEGGDPSSEQVILEVDQPFANHNGGQIVFGPDGYLYIGLGDGGSGRDPRGNGQNTGTLLGSILRIDVSGGGAGYAVPGDNPFVGQPSALGEIWAYGLRNPWRFSFDAATGELWAGDVGQNTREEIDLIVKGGNYGWNVMEGFGCLDGGDNCDQDGLLLPVTDYANGGGECSVTGGFVYRGSDVAALQGAYVYGDYCSGKIWALRYDGNQVTDERQIAQADFRISSFAQGNDGEIYVLETSQAGGIYRIVP